MVPETVEFYAPGTLWLDGGLGASVQNGERLCVLFVGLTTGQPWMLFLSDGAGNPVVPALPRALFTGSNSVDDAGTTQALCANTPAGLTGAFYFMALYLDGSSRLALSAEVQLDVL